MTAAFQTRTICHQMVGDSLLLDAVSGAEHARVFFASGPPVSGAKAGVGSKVVARQTIGGALVLTVRAGDPMILKTDAGRAKIALSAPELGLFEDQNTLLGIRNGESAGITGDWLRWHVENHGATAALIVDRAKPEGNSAYLNTLRKTVAQIKGLKTVTVVQFDAPLGRADLPAEHHPFCAPDAPGKDRMKVPAPAPWQAPLGQLSLFEILRHRFLDRARAVAFLEISDLLQPQRGDTVFDTAQNDPGGFVPLIGQHVYPWRVRKGEDAHFADHICQPFDSTNQRKRWCVAPAVAGPGATWRYVRITGTPSSRQSPIPFWRFMGLRHPVDSVSKIVPKTALIEHDALLALAQDTFGHKPVRMPEMKAPKVNRARNSVTIITTMKNEGPFILEWIAYHRAIGVDNFLVYTNDCTDGTDAFHALLQDKGIVQHRDNPFKSTGLKPQHAALQAGENEEIIKSADWVICMDVDEFINIKTGDGTLKALFDAVPNANMISLTWRLFGNSDIHDFADRPIIADYTRCAPEMARKPHQAWGFKTLFRNIGLFKKLGVHRPKGLNPQLWEQIHWVNGSGAAMPKEFYRNAWRSTQSTVGYDLVCLNHYAVRSAESFLVKRDRGRVNHVDRDQGLAYWFRMNFNVEEDRSIQRMLPALQREMDTLLADPDIAAMHARCVTAHRAKIDALKATDNYAAFFDELTGPRMQRLSRMLPNFGANVFLAGPSVIPDEVAFGDQDPDFFFTVARQDTTAH
ncbi:glycosyltransferase family 2 protein [Cognatishimia sp. SS12]|uniref:glycosyltransferase family 2 protein n=1 Tax=Cognatishimia sp. SS12 TaxID=2979465 RepID=UPI00233123A5|nr:glycosyltransferase family 2 protein [Cognatishimia sp. SS12]MDC0737869.1 glycosyltransferase family 2 protein [Cognatishimia sp. SS12]